MENNLLIYFDAIDNTGTGTHADDTTTWSDLSGSGNDGTIYGAAWSDRYLLFDGNSWVNCGQQNPRFLTLEAYVKFNAVGGSNEESNAVVGNWQSGGYGIQQKNALHAANININGTWYHVYGTVPSTDRAVHLTVSYDGSVIKFYENGVKVSEQSVSGSIKSPTYNTVLSVGSNPNGASLGISGLSGCVYVIRLYDKALSDAEVLSDYEYDYERYVDHIYKYLVRNDGVLYTVVDGALSELTGELTSELFQTSGIGTVPDGALLLPLSAPEVLCWTDAPAPCTLTATVQGVPTGAHTVTSDHIQVDHPSIYGISSVVATASDGATFLLSFDGGEWMKYNDGTWSVSDIGMTAAEIMAIPYNAWSSVINSAQYMQLKATLEGVETVTQVVFNYDNESPTS